MTDPVADHNQRTGAWLLGATIQGLVLGVAVAFAILKLLEVASDAQVFRYQGF